MWAKTTLQIVGAALILTLVGCMLFADRLNGDAEEYSRLTTEFVLVHERTEKVRADRDRMQSEFGALERGDHAFLEKVIREDYGYVKKNETVLLFND
jgi:cell division protein FtsB